MKRFVGQIWTVEYAGGYIYSSAGAKTTHQRRYSGAWFADDIPEIRLKFEGQWYQQSEYGTSPVFTEKYDETKYNTNEIKRVFEWCTNTSCNFQIVNMSSYHYGICDDYQVRECTLNY
jgi:hypothetical protein